MGPGQRHRGRAPAAGGLEGDREPGGQGDHAAAVESDQVVGRRTARGHRPVAGEQLGVVAPRTQRLPGHPQLGRAGRVQRRGGRQPGQQGAAPGEVDRAPVVRVDQRVVPQLGALVDVGDAGQGELDQLLTERVEPARPLDHGVDRVPGGPQLGVVVGQVDRCGQRRLEVLVRSGPAGVLRRLARRLLGVVVQPLTLDRAGADDGLGQEVGQPPVRDRGPRPGTARRTRPRRHRPRPARPAGPGCPRRVWCRGSTAPSSSRARHRPGPAAARGTRRPGCRTGPGRRPPR